MTATPTPDDGAALLKRCPFCGGEARSLMTHLNHWIVECTECGVTQDDPSVGPDARESIAAWNTRSPAPVSGEAGETKALEAVAAVVLNAARDPATWTARIPSESIEDWVRRAIAIAIALQRPKVRQAFAQHCAGAGREGLPATTREP